MTTNWRSAPDHRTAPTLDWVTDMCESALRKAEQWDGEIEIIGVFSPLQVKPERERNWKNHASMILSDLTLVVSHKISIGRGSAASMVLPLKEITGCTLSDSSGTGLQVVHPAKLVGLTFSTSEECAAVMDWYTEFH